MILVTGGTGFIGKALIRHLVELGHPVRTLIRPAQRTNRNLRPQRMNEQRTASAPGEPWQPRADRFLCCRRARDALTCPPESTTPVTYSPQEVACITHVAVEQVQLSWCCSHVRSLAARAWAFR